MPKDYQEIERIVEDFEYFDGQCYPNRHSDWLRNTLTTYGNAREREGVEKVLHALQEGDDAYKVLERIQHELK
jgi:hypothetical protein